MTIISKKELNRGIEIDLTGEQGNAFFILGLARRYGRQLGFSQSKINQMIEQMMSSDYENLISIFDTHFGEYVTLLR